MCCTRAIDLLVAPRIPHENHAIIHATNPHGVYRSASVDASVSCEASFPPHTLSKTNLSASHIRSVVAHSCTGCAQRSHANL